MHIIVRFRPLGKIPVLICYKQQCLLATLTTSGCQVCLLPDNVGIPVVREPCGWAATVGCKTDVRVFAHIMHSDIRSLKPLTQPNGQLQLTIQKTNKKSMLFYAGFLILRAVDKSRVVAQI